VPLCNQSGVFLKIDYLIVVYNQSVFNRLVFLWGDKQSVYKDIVNDQNPATDLRNSPKIIIGKTQTQRYIYVTFYTEIQRRNFLIDNICHRE